MPSESQNRQVLRTIEVGRLDVRGWLPAQIAEKFNVSQKTIQRDLEAIDAERRKSLPVNRRASEEQYRAYLDEIERLARQGWEDSFKPIRVERITVDDMGRETRRSRLLQQRGDPGS